MEIAIKPYAENDVDELYGLVVSSADHLKPWMPWFHSEYSIRDTQSWVRMCIEDWKNGNAFRYLIRTVNSNHIVGCVGLERIVKSHKIAELGYWVGASAKDKGVATTAGTLAVSEAFQRHGIQRIEINVLTDNGASNKVALKIGGLLEGTFRNKLYHNGRSNPANCYSIVPGDQKI